MPKKNAAAVRQRLNNKVLKLLSYRPRSIHEIKTRLKIISQSDKLIQQIIDDFTQNDLLNDQHFADWWVDQRLTHKPKGNIALTSELFQKGIHPDIIDSVLLDFHQEKNLAKKLLKSKNITLKSKAYQVLKSKGFTFSSISSAIDELKLKE